MRELGHVSIDLLKMDIEGAEYDVLADMISQRIPVKQLLVEFHHRWPQIGVGRTKQAIQALNAAGYPGFLMFRPAVKNTASCNSSIE